MQIVILAGGLATRMHARFPGLPKILIPVAGRPFIDRQLERLARRGATNVVLCLGHLAEQVRAHLAGHAPVLPVTIVADGPRLVGTGGAVRAALEAGALEERFVLGFGDSFLAAELSPIMATHRRANRPVTMTLFRNDDRLAPSNCAMTEDRVTWYGKPRSPEDRPPEARWIDYGLTVLERPFVASWSYPEPFDLALVLGEAARRGDVSAHEVDHRFHEIGSVEGLAALEDALARNDPLVT